MYDHQDTTAKILKTLVEDKKDVRKVEWNNKEVRISPLLGSRHIQSCTMRKSGFTYLNARKSNPALRRSHDLLRRKCNLTPLLLLELRTSFVWIQD